MRTAIKHDRITISLPHGYTGAIKGLATELEMSQSELIAVAFEAYRNALKKQKIEKMALALADEYRHNADLVALACLDGEDFI